MGIRLLDWHFTCAEETLSRTKLGFYDIKPNFFRMLLRNVLTGVSALRRNDEMRVPFNRIRKWLQYQVVRVR